MSQNVFSATSTQAATLATDSTGVTGADWRIDDEKRPLAPGAAFKGAGHVPGPIDTGAAMQSDGRMNGPPYGPGMRPQQGMMSPTFGGGGNPIHHLPPQGPWKLEESHLSEPLAASRNRQSGGSLSPQQQSFFGYEKEMGVPPPAAPRPETQLPPRQKFSEVPPSSAQRYPGLFSPPQREQNPGSPTGPRTSRDLGQQYYGRDSTSLYRTQTGDSDVSTFDPSVDEERGRSRRSSGFFKEIGGRFSRESSRRRPASKAAEAAPGDPVGPVSPDVRGGEVSEASVATREFQDRQRRRSSFFLNLRGSRPSDAGVPQSGDREGITQSPKPSPNPGVSPPVQQPASFADRKRLFLGPPGNELSPALPNSSLSRSSTSTVGNDAAGGVVGPPKKRFSGFTSKVFSRTSSQQDLQIPQKPGTSHSATSSMLGRPPGTPALGHTTYSKRRVINSCNMLKKRIVAGGAQQAAFSRGFSANAPHPNTRRISSQYSVHRTRMCKSHRNSECSILAIKHHPLVSDQPIEVEVNSRREACSSSSGSSSIKSISIINKHISLLKTPMIIWQPARDSIPSLQ
ncbi:hypothetical protein ColKHC_12655 [Colletotrichum higginsianum]|nr:hypothetical protein ColKHC_12655 [Colletotrichum higginsianum]